MQNTVSPTSVPLLDLDVEYAPLREQLLAAVTRVLDNHQFILGPEVSALERELSAAIGVPHAIGVSSGTDAILASLMAAGIRAGDEVITSTYSFFATAGCISRVGATPMFVDIDPVTYNLDARAVVAAVTPRTRAIIAVHLYGQVADMEPLGAVAAQSGAALIEDACQAIGARYRGRAAGAIGDYGCFSFYPSKNLSACGDGGLVTATDEARAERVRLIRQHGAQPKYYHRLIGGNFRLDAVQAALLRVKLPHLPEWTAARRRNAERYARLFREHALEERGVVLPVERDGNVHVYNQYVIRGPRRDDLRNHLKTRGVGTEVYYPVPFHLQECFADLGYRAGQFPHAEAAAQQTLALPIFPGVTEAQQAHVVQSVAEFYTS